MYFFVFGLYFFMFGLHFSVLDMYLDRLFDCISDSLAQPISIFQVVWVLFCFLNGLQLSHGLQLFAPGLEFSACFFLFCIQMSREGTGLAHGTDTAPAGGPEVVGGGGGGAAGHAATLGAELGAEAALAAAEPGSCAEAKWGGETGEGGGEEGGEDGEAGGVGEVEGAGEFC